MNVGVGELVEFCDVKTKEECAKKTIYVSDTNDQIVSQMKNVCIWLED